MRPAWVIMTVFAIYVAGVAIGGIVAPPSRSSFMAEVFARSPVAAVFHFAGGAVAIIAGAFQVSRRFRERNRKRHRRLGAFYILGVVAGGGAALPLAAVSTADLVTRIGFGALAVCWLATTLLAFRAIWRRDIPTHQRWMYRSYALTLAAVTLRIYMPLSQVMGIPFEDAYRVVAWICWVTNLVIVESWFVARARAQTADA